MTDPLSLTEVKRLASTADTILLRATRTADLETPIGAFLRLDDGVTPAYLLESVEGGERLGRYSFLGIGPRRLLEVRDGVAHTTSRPVGVTEYAPGPPRDHDRERRTRSPPCAPSSPGGASSPWTGCRASPAARSARSRYDAISTFEPSVPLPEKDPVGVPLASFIETDLVIVFDHLTHQLSAIASLHTDAPDLEGRYRIAERAIFEALERTARPSAAEMTASFTRPGDEAAGATSLGQVETSLGRDQYIGAVERAKDAIAAGEAIQVVLARRQSFDLPAVADGSRARRHRPVPGPPPREPRRRTCSSPARRGSRSWAPARSSWSRSSARRCPPTPSPAPGPAARPRPRTTAWPTSSAAIPRSAPST